MVDLKVVRTGGCGMEVMNSKVLVWGLSQASRPSGESPLDSIISASAGSLSVGESSSDCSHCMSDGVEVLAAGACGSCVVSCWTLVAAICSMCGEACEARES